ncbi:NUDIX hydrolase [Candidatus Mycosynbacter amalyticus]|nr:NUDIX hydrolase [Candidatus Mycosynbacter amalyticus]
MWRSYYFMMKLIGPLALTVFYLLNNITRAKRARALVIAPEGQILLVMNSLGDRRWTLPGGGMKRHETPEVAALRELAEELDLEIGADRVISLGELPSGSYRAPIVLVRLRAEELLLVRADKFEIYAYRWCDLDRLPTPIQPVVHGALGLLSARDELATIK